MCIIILQINRLGSNDNIDFVAITIYRSPLSQRSINRLSMIDDTGRPSHLSISNQDLCSNSSSMNHLHLIGRHGIQSLPTETGRGGSFQSINESEFVDLRYVESPVGRSNEFVCSDLSLEREMVRNLEKNVSKEKARRSFPGYLRGRESGDETHTHTEISGIRRNSFSADQSNTFMVHASR